ncbi:phenylacetic acid degradation protein [Alicyclobacillus tolerans]|uniref:Ring-1,2-phenylacetyl-CoA epoxidase subunit PaaB n=1 Tax=Alicyclobacillus tolerans TaxID=90970 RepID=A0ABT9LTS6_9BACL|nr:phenylacetic acid degradation protein [Alicyclobacillus tengchongensis]MDP9727661.1 ring-1,2-phenylacetyl-CoA epoxidase subunit PaaB [Alicyclobacillus tengchongensis]
MSHTSHNESAPVTGEQIYEVFVQSNHQEAHQHVGSLLAPDDTMAMLLARENFLRRDKAVSLWVVPRSAFIVKDSEDGAFLKREFDRSYREVRGYADNAARWKAFKAKALTLEEVIEDVRTP